MLEAQIENDERSPMPDRKTLVRDVLVLQLKLVVDGFRDLILVPISLAFGIVSLVKMGGGGGMEFYELLRKGRHSERWINLFGAAERVYGPAIDDEAFPVEDIDELVDRVESFVVDEYAKGGVTRQVKDQLDKSLDSLHRLASRKRRRDDGGS
jgi:hypothetical protein